VESPARQSFFRIHILEGNVSLRLAIIVSIAASFGGQVSSAQSARTGSLQAAQSQAASVPAQTFDGPPRAEDSPQSQAANLIFYNNPRGVELTPAPPPPGTVSVEQLQHPLSRKGAKLIAQARNFSAMGRHDQAIEQLQLALKETSAVPYAYSMLGVEYLKTNRVASAITELEQALALLPRNVVDRSNLGYALFLSGDLERAETETRQALELDRNNAKTQRVLNQILTARKSQGSRLP
jgi:tetratricopeptide (TPR) repeat protein